MPYSIKSKQTWGSVPKKTIPRPRARPKVVLRKPVVKKNRKRPGKTVLRTALRPSAKASKNTSNRRSNQPLKRGQKLGSFLGAAAKSAVGTFFGSGEYTEALGNEVGVPGEEIANNTSDLYANSLVHPVSSDFVAQMHTSQEGAVKITRREFIGTIEIEDDVTNYEFIVNPVVKQLFPWLSSIAGQWQQYIFTGLAVEYIPTSGYAVGDDKPALGQVAMCFVYDTTTGPGTYPAGDLTAMLNHEGAVSTSPAAPSVCFMECDPGRNNQPVKIMPRDEGTLWTPVNFSQQNVNCAKLQILTSGATSLTKFQAGQLWITYEIEMFNPRTNISFSNNPITPINPAIMEDLEYIRFRRMLRQYFELYHHCGPYTSDELFARTALLETLAGNMHTPELVKMSARWEAIMRASVDVRSTTNEDQPLLDMIHKTEIYKLMLKIDPPKHPPTPLDVTAAEVEDWDNISQASRSAPIGVARY